MVEVVWEEIDRAFTLLRARVPGGWLVVSVDEVSELAPNGRAYGFEWRTAPTFVPDPEHSWVAKVQP